MPKRVIPLITGEYYHVFNRGVNKMQTFNSSKDYSHFLETVSYYQIKRPIRFSYWNPLKSNSNNQQVIRIEIIAYCLMPNHFHLLLRQIEENGIQEFMRLLQNSFTKYFNTKNKRSGPLFQGRFKASHIDDTDTLLHISRYIHLNPLVSSVVKDIEAYPWSSYFELIQEEAHIANQQVILDQFKSHNNYKDFILDHADYATKLESIKHLIHE